MQSREKSHVIWLNCKILFWEILMSQQRVVTSFYSKKSLSREVISLCQQTSITRDRRPSLVRPHHPRINLSQINPLLAHLSLYSKPFFQEPIIKTWTQGWEKISVHILKTHYEEESNPMLVWKRANKGGTSVPKVWKENVVIRGMFKTHLEERSNLNLNSHQLWEIHVKLAWESNKLNPTRSDIRVWQSK